MQTNHPNRIRTQIADFDNILQKKSGDQHIEPEDDGLDAPHRPHRVNREDMQKINAPGKEENEGEAAPD
ncbi:MAG: hypothetical protein JWR25_1816 [Noviherbaspirillum sp.]|jgi:hypothetical protein|nr:hypothetical protein [Noviherbaspirillum sp.]MDB5795437.1 hypothetical protein [Noviherbaspirillum sp.]